MKRKIIKAARKIQKMCDKITCDRCDFVLEIGWCIFTKNSPNVWELPPLPKKKKTVTYVKSVKDIMIIANRQNAQIGVNGDLIFEDKNFLAFMFQYCGKRYIENDPDTHGGYYWDPEWLEERKE